MARNKNEPRAPAPFSYGRPPGSLSASGCVGNHPLIRISLSAGVDGLPTLLICSEAANSSSRSFARG